MRFRCLIPILLLVLCAGSSVADDGEKPLRIFGYFQNSLQRWTDFEDHRAQTFFNLQQLNLLFQKDLNNSWAAFLNFEFLNNYSSQQRWGAARLEEAWVRYRLNEKLNLKLGLQIPIFNNLNEINNRTPLLPYITRPLVYESSFSDFLPLDEWVPPTAFVQSYGYLPAGEIKLDYAVYLGNSSNINDNPDLFQTGLDTTEAFLVGARLGLRRGDLKAGVSGTYEKTNVLAMFATELGMPARKLEDRPKVRYGADFSYGQGSWWFNGEYIVANFDTGTPRLELDLDFYYWTLGYNLSEQLLAYITYWDTEVHELAESSTTSPEDELHEDIRVYGAGTSYSVGERIRLKAQYARVVDDDRLRYFSTGTTEKKKNRFGVSSVAVSVLF